MGKHARWIFCSFLLGSLLCANDRFQPLHLKALRINGFSPELEAGLRDWGDSFMDFHPAWLLARSDLRSLENRYPLTVDSSWNPFTRTLELTAVPIVPLMKVVWQYGEYIVSPDDRAWPRSLWEESLEEGVPELPTLKVGSTYPLFDGDRSGAVKLKIPAQDLYSLYGLMASPKGLEVRDLELSRRGGEDTVNCVFADKTKKCTITFIGNVSGLEKSLSVVRELVNTHAGENISLDATYRDKIIIKKGQPSG